MDQTPNYSKLSKRLTKNIPKKEKKQNGIYFTPPQTVIKSIKLIEPYIKNINTVLEPSCGSCEYINQMSKLYNNLKISGIELNQTIYESIKQFESDNIKLLNTDFILYDTELKYDLIFGNPPFFTMTKANVDKKYYKYFEGRPNIFILFIIKSLSMLNKNGILSFILPKNFLNCLNYDKTRKHIESNYEIINIIECVDKYIETQQETILLMVQNKKPTQTNNIMNIGTYTIFGTVGNIEKIKSYYTDSKKLCDLHFNVSIGTVVWNQCKDELTTDKKKTLLIYSSDITDGKLQIKTYTNKAKKNYIDKVGNKEPILVLNRGYGNGEYTFNYCLINEKDNIEYLIENHLIRIKYTKQIERDKLIKMYKKIINSFENKKTREFVKLYFGNNAINTTELNTIVPFYGL
jgi:type I restriction-modification system DNA methylase subunit